MLAIEFKPYFGDVIVTKSVAEEKHILGELHEASSKVGLEINMTKLQLMTHLVTFENVIIKTPE